MKKAVVDSYLLNNGWQKFIDDDDVDYFAIGPTQVVVPEEKLEDAEYDRLLNEALDKIAEYEGCTKEALVAKINATVVKPDYHSKAVVDNYLLNNGWQKFIDDDDVDYFAIGPTQIVLPEEKLEEDEYERLLNDALKTIADYEGCSVEEIKDRINKSVETA